MKLRFLGVGGAFEPEYGNSSAIVEAGAGALLLIDCGCTVYSQLRQSGDIDKVTHVLITHLHDDHVGSLGSLIYHRYYVTRRKVELVFAPALREPLLTLLGLQHTTGPISERAELRELSPATGEGDLIGDTRVSFLDTTGRHQAGMPSSAFLFSRHQKHIAYSGDLGDADFLFHTLDGHGVSNATILHDTCFSELPSRAHAYYKDLERHLGSWKIFGYHNNPSQRPADCRIPLAWDDPEYAPPRVSAPRAEV